MLSGSLVTSFCFLLSSLVIDALWYKEDQVVLYPLILQCWLKYVGEKLLFQAPPLFIIIFLFSKDDHTLIRVEKESLSLFIPTPFLTESGRIKPSYLFCCQGSTFSYCGCLLGLSRCSWLFWSLLTSVCSIHQSL